MKKMVFILMAAVWLTFTGCGGSGTDKGEGEAAKTTDRGAYAVRIVPEKTLFTETDRSAGCEVVLTDEKGNTVHRKVTWRSSHPDVVDVDADGNFHVKGQVGSSQIVVTTEENVSRSIIVLVTRPAPGVVLVDDGDVEGAVVLTDVNATYGVGTRYMFRWKHAAVPSPGTLMLGTGTQPIAGKVIDAKASGGVVEVELEVVPVDELFEALEMDERVDSETMEPIWNESVVRDYEIEREDEAFRLRPKEVGLVLEPKYGTSVNRRSFGFGGSNFRYKFALGIFECEASAATTPVRVSVPQFSISHPMWVDVAFSLQNHDFKFVLHNDYEARLDLDLDVVASWTGGLECTKDLVTFPIPVTGAASWFFGFYVPLGIGFGMSGELEVANLKYHLQSRASVKMEAGIDCESGQCENVTDVDGNDSEVTGRWDVPTGDFSQNFRLKPKVEGFGYAKMQMGIDPRIVHMAPGLQTARILQLDLVQISGGLSGEGDFATRRGQLFNDDYASEYGLYSFFTWKTGNNVNNLLSSLLHVRNGSLSLEKKYELAKSPRVRSFTADRYAYDALTTVTFEIELDPDTVELGWLGYNIDKLNVYRRVELPDGSESIEKIFTIEPAGEETSFRHEWLALDEGVTEDNIFVMVESKYVPPFGEFGELELASCHVSEGFERTLSCLHEPTMHWVYDNHHRLLNYSKGNTVDIFTYEYDDNDSDKAYHVEKWENGKLVMKADINESLPLIEKKFVSMGKYEQKNIYENYLSLKTYIPIYRRGELKWIDPNEEPRYIIGLDKYIDPYLEYESIEVNYEVHHNYYQYDATTETIYDLSNKTFRKIFNYPSAVGESIYQYNAQNQIIKQTEDYITYYFDVNGSLKAGGRIKKNENLLYNDHKLKNWSLQSNTDLLDGSYEHSRSAIFNYDVSDRLVRIYYKDEYIRQDEDVSQYEVEVVHTRNEKGDIITTSVDYSDDSGDEYVVTKIIDYEYDENGRIIKKSFHYHYSDPNVRKMACDGFIELQYFGSTNNIRRWGIHLYPADENVRCKEYYKNCEIYDTRWGN